MTNEESETKQWIEQAAPGATVQVGTERIVVDPVTGKLTTEPVKHWSDCAVHSEPAYPAGQCDCHLSIASRLDELMVHAYQGSTDVADEIAKELIDVFERLSHWQDLTIDEINEVLGSDIHDEPSGELEFVRAIEVKLKEKNT